MNNYIKRRRKMSVVERESRRGRGLQTRGVELSSMYISFENNLPADGFVTMNVNNVRVGVRALGGEKYHVEVGEDFSGTKKRSGIVSYEEANRFIHENTKG